MKHKKVFYAIAVLITLLLSTTIVGAGVVQQKFIKEVGKRYNASELWYIQTHIDKIVTEKFPNLPLEVHNGLVAVIEFIYLTLAIVMGHNEFTKGLTELISLILVAPLIMVSNIGSGRGYFFTLLKENLDSMYIGLEDVLFNRGLLGLLIYPFLLSIALTGTILQYIATLPTMLGSNFMDDFIDTLNAVNWGF
jgi:hypothetical protein